ncbi:ComF family protein [Exilibacterium tricleocarpae]|uniref:ComF family protein n=1 Tax=Exilibacterium tricleocarpae TaxID=2591008 RepID=A0A545T3R9_9GAMM|nr:ComF family protein [Exilibacterium tricleocarpae]TQV71835.1 ComF family protein [Exilibacterium tricleocarpae]
MPHLTRFIDYLLPARCLLCDLTVTGPDCICAGCRGDLPQLPAGCRRCALPLPGDADICGACLQRPPAFARTLAPFTFMPPVDTLIHAYKYRRQLAAGALLGQLLAQHLRRAYADDQLPEWLLPVPLHWRRLLLRGFNQAALLAAQLGRELALPVVDGCRRRVHTPPQAGVERQRRRRNLRGAFTLRCDPAHRHVAIVDDVVTTTSTVAELAGLLAAAGARRVDIWCIARTLQSY